MIGNILQLQGNFESLATNSQTLGSQVFHVQLFGDNVDHSNSFN